MMKKLIAGFIVVLCVAVAVVRLSADDLTDGVQKINDGLYVGKKGDLYFALERVTAENSKFWREYVWNQQKKAQEQGTKEAAGSFGDALEYYDKNGVKNNVWVAYVTSKKVNAQAQKLLQKENDIEMVVTVSTTDKLPFYTPMGIFRAVEFSTSKNKHLSMKLHSFIAKTMMAIYGNKDYMATRPLDSMRTIMGKNLPKEAIWVDDATRLAISLSKGELTVLDRSGKKVTLAIPSFFQQSSLWFSVYPLVVVDIDALAGFMKLDRFE